MLGYARHMDKTGRITIPKDMLRAGNIKEDSLVYITPVPEGILLTPGNKNCKLCGSSKEVLHIDDIHICRSCARKIFERGGY